MVPYLTAGGLCPPVYVSRGRKGAGFRSELTGEKKAATAGALLPIFIDDGDTAPGQPEDRTLSHCKLLG